MMKNSNHDTLIEMKQITKRFPGVLANDCIDLTIAKGEIHTLLGENGAGKSTLMKILYGLYKPNSGEIYFKGKQVNFKSPLDANQKGIGMVQQHFSLVESFTVAENIMFGSKTVKDTIRSPKDFLLNRKQMKQVVDNLADQYGFSVNPNDKIWQLSAGEQQRVEILKAVFSEVDVLILDESTSVLTPQETQDFFQVLRRLNEKGLTIIFITHILEEALNISDRITILRDGKTVATIPAGKTTKKELAKLMVGREILFDLKRELHEFGQPYLVVKGISAKNDRALDALNDVSFSVRQGEIYGIAGIAGNGQSELAEVLTGNRKVSTGKFFVGDVDCTNKNQRFLLQLNIAHIPEKRMIIGVNLSEPLLENTLLTRFYEGCFCNNFLVDWDSVKECTESMINEFNVKTAGTKVGVGTLSGGNIQKFILARELLKQPKLIIAVHPTMGLDVGATEFIRNRLLAERMKGVAILLISESLEEIMVMSDTIGVLHKGNLVGEFSSDKANLNTLGYLMAGGKNDGE